MPRSTTCCNDNTFGIQKFIFIIDKTGKCNIVFIHIYTSAHRIAESFGLFENFLDHKMRIAAFFELTEGHFEFFDLRSFLHIRYGFDAQLFVTFKRHNFFIAHINHLIGELNNWSSIRCQKIFVFAYSHYERTSFACRYNHIWSVLFNHGNSISSNYLIKRKLYGCCQIYLI